MEEKVRAAHESALEKLGRAGVSVDDVRQSVQMLFNPEEPRNPIFEIGAKLSARIRATTRLKDMLNRAAGLFEDSSEPEPSRQQLAESVARVAEALDALQASAKRVGNAEASRRCRTTFEFPWLITTRHALLTFLTKQCKLTDHEIACLLVIGDGGKPWVPEYRVRAPVETTDDVVERARDNVRKILSRERLRRKAAPHDPPKRGK